VMSGTEPAALPPYTGTLTPEHLAVIRAERDQWRQIGLSTTPADRPAAEAAVRHAYQAAGLQPPGSVVWMDSPLGGCLAKAAIRRHRDQLAGQRWRRIRRQLRDQLVGDRLREPFRQQLNDQLGDQLRYQLDEQLRDELRGHHELDDQLQGQLGEQLWGRLPGQLDAVRGQLGGQLSPWRDAYWLALSRCERRIVGLAPSPRLDALADAVASLGWWWPLHGSVVLTDRPVSIAHDQQGRLHAEDGPALAWTDGSNLYAIHGVRVPAHVVHAPDTITIDQIRGEPDVEVRRVLLERYGHQRYLRDAGAQRVHADGTGILWRCRLPGDEDLVLVEVANATPEPDGTARTYWLRVPPDVRTARQAVAWTFDVDEGDYQPETQT